MENSTRNTIWLDILATGLACDIFSSIQECLDYMDEYWAWYSEEAQHGESALCGLLKIYIDSYQRGEGEHASLFTHNPNEINPAFLKRKITEWQAEGMLEQSPNAKLISETMNYLGWQLVPGKWVKMK